MMLVLQIAVGVILAKANNEGILCLLDMLIKSYALENAR